MPNTRLCELPANYFRRYKRPAPVEQNGAVNFGFISMSDATNEKPLITDKNTFFLTQISDLLRENSRGIYVNEFARTKGVPEKPGAELAEQINSEIFG
jgi:hypothetical protein